MQQVIKKYTQKKLKMPQSQSVTLFGPPEPVQGELLLPKGMLRLHASAIFFFSDYLKFGL
jgi:hypothetical protein